MTNSRPQAIADLAAKRAELSPDAIALEEFATGRTLTYAGLDQRAAAVAALLDRRGVNSGERVAVLCRNRIAFFELLFGCAKAGVIMVPLNWRMPACELDGLIADCAPSLLFHGVEDAAIVQGLSQPPAAIDLDDDYETQLSGADGSARRHLWPAGELWYLIYTSGTTGRPKGVIYTYGMALANYVNIGTAIRLSARDTTVAFLPNFHTAGINLHALPTLLAGGRVIILPGFDADALVGLLEQRRLDTVFAVPTVYQALVEHPRFAQAHLDHVRHWGCGGAPLPDALATTCRTLGVRVCNGMGMTETGPTAFLVDPDDAWEKIGSVGKPQLLCSVRVVDDAGQDVADGEVGDLLFSGPGVTPGYWRNAKATADAFTPDGWLKSGDLAVRDRDGFYFVVGRRKDMYISGGENVYPAEVENVLSSHPKVVDAAVMAAPHPKWGEVGHAFVQLAPGTERDLAPIHAYCRSRLASFKVPQLWDIVDEFPRTSAGKIQKHLLANEPVEPAARHSTSA
jgi:fatty-acyl-CoA synthase